MTTPTWSAPPPPPPPSPADSTRVKGAVGVVLVLVAALVVIAVVPSKSWYPKSWDPRIAPIAAKVSDLRGLNFVHPVQVHFLNAHDFTQLYEGKDTSISAADRQSFATQAAVGRALGFLGPKDDLAQSSKTQAESDVAAFYSNAAKEVFVNGTNLDVEHQVTVAHELTHALQDQHFDLEALSKKAVASTTGDTEAYTALIEGDAVRIQNDYLRGLSATQQREYLRENNTTADATDTADASVPDILEFLFRAPYEFGPATANVLFAEGGNLSVDNALTGPTPGSRILLEPAELTPPRSVEKPELPSGAKPVGEEDQEMVSAFELYPMLATSMPAVKALHASDDVDGTNALTYTQNGKVCEAINLVPRSPHDVSVAPALRAWARSHPSARVSTQGEIVKLTACDPGAKATTPSHARFVSADAFLDARTQFTEGIAQDKVAADDARCTARLYMDNPTLARILVKLLDHQPSADDEAKIRDAAVGIVSRCKVDPTADLR